MPINHEIKSQLAKLLATEDLVVEHKQVETASFNVQTRVLTLPIWEKATNNIYDLLVAHEVGHALFTPDEDWDFTVPKQFVNVTEDARIEKLMKRKYAGLNKTFFNGYKELHQDDFFNLEDEDVENMNLADRANLWFKVGSHANISIKQEELYIINMIADAETFEDAVKAAEELYKYCKQEIAPETTQQMSDITQEGGDSTQEYGEGQSEDRSEDFGNSGGESMGAAASNIWDKEEPEVKTDSSLKENIDSLVTHNTIENVYLEIPKLNLNTVIASNKEVHEYIKLDFAFQQENSDIGHKKYQEKIINLFGDVDTQYQQFKNSAQKEVNYLVKEFECRKAADSYARATTARTGVLDCSKLHTYKYNEDLFRKVTTLAEGKNHGLVFILDWSGSMSGVMMDTIKQLYNLIWFCKKVAIPFEVYAFTGEWSRVEYDKLGKPILPAQHYTKRNGLLYVDERFKLMQFFTNKVNSNTLEQQMKNIWRVAYSFYDATLYHYPHRLSLSGTPLNESLIALHQILPKFQKENKLQKVQCVVLTDGEANPVPYSAEFRRYPDAPLNIGMRTIPYGCSFLRDRVTGNTYKISGNYFEFSDILLRNLRDNFPTVNFIGMRVLLNRDANHFIKHYVSVLDKQYDKIMNDWKKTRSFAIKNSGYHSYFGLSATALSQDTDFDVAEDATKSQIKSAFAKSLKCKKLNKKILGEFVELIA
jgi:hypothetical protein